MLRSPRTSRRRTVGVEIEPGRVIAVEGGAGDRPSVERVATAPLDPDVVRDGEVLDPEALGLALKELFREHKLDRRVRFGVANGRIVVRTLDLPPIEDEKALAAAVRFQAADELPMPLDEAVLDFHSLGPVETEAGPRHRVVVVAARRDMVMQVIEAARAAGLRPQGIDLSAFGMVRALAPSGAPTLLLSVGGLTNLAVAADGVCLFTRVVGSGIEGVAAEVAERRGIPLAEARELVFEVGLDGADPAAPAEPAAAVEPVAPADEWLGGDLLDPAARPMPKITFGGGDEMGDEPLDPHARPLRPLDDEPAAAEEPVARAEEPVALEELEIVPEPVDEVVAIEPEPEPEPVAAVQPQPVPVRAPAPAEPAVEGPAQVVRALLREAVQRIAGEARATVDFHLGPQQGDGVSRALLTGPALNVPGFREALAEELGMDVEAGTVPADDAADGAHAVAAGLTVTEVAA